jgi:hypothetical protein
MRIFLSYEERDERFADALRSQLDDLGVNVWNPSDELFPGSNWLLETGRALERADGIVMLLSSNTRSRWSQLEMEYVLTQRRYKRRVIPVLLKKTARIPWILRQFAIDGTSGDAAKTAQKIAQILLPKPRRTVNERMAKAVRTKRAASAAGRVAKTARIR